MAHLLFAGLLLWSLPLFAEDGGTEQDPLRAKAAEGNKIAMFKLGDEYFYGTKTRLPNPTLAAYWYKKAADAGLPEAMFNYAVCLERGTGVEKNRFEAYDWMKKAADAGVKMARFQLAMTDLYGIPEDKERGLPAKPPLATYALSQLEQLAEEQFIPAETVLAELLLRQNNANSVAKGSNSGRAHCYEGSSTRGSADDGGLQIRRGRSQTRSGRDDPSAPPGRPTGRCRSPRETGVLL